MPQAIHWIDFPMLPLKVSWEGTQLTCALRGRSRYLAVFPLWLAASSKSLAASIMMACAIQHRAFCQLNPLYKATSHLKHLIQAQAIARLMRRRPNMPYEELKCGHTSWFRVVMRLLIAVKF